MATRPRFALGAGGAIPIDDPAEDEPDDTTGYGRVLANYRARYGRRGAHPTEVDRPSKPSHE